MKIRIALGLALAALGISRGFAQSSLSIALTNQLIQISWPAQSPSPPVLEQSSTLGDPAAWQEVTQSPLLQGKDFILLLSPTNRTQYFRLRSNQGFRLSGFTPQDGATEVGVTVRPQIRFSESVNPQSLDVGSFYASFSGHVLPATIVPANDGSYAWLFFQQLMPAGARIQVTVDGSRITSAESGQALDAQGNGTPGSIFQFEFTTVSLAALPGTSLTGIVVDPGPDLIPNTADDVQINPDGTKTYLLPIPGVQVHLLGLESQSITTGPDGNFFFGSVPNGDVKVVVDGTTALQAPTGFYFPEMVIDAHMVLGITNSTMQDGPAVYLPRLAKSILQPVNSSTTSVLTATAAGAPNLSAFQRSQLSLTVPPNSMTGLNGQPMSSGQIGISTVPSQLVMDMLPPGVLQHTFDITVQAPGVAVFSTPAPLTFPNVFNAAPGTKLDFLSFDHTTGRLVIEGTATVSADGSSVRTDPGTGVTHPGWHGLTPPGGPNSPPCRPSKIHNPALQPQPVYTGLQDYFFKDDDGTMTLSFANAAPVPSDDPCDSTPVPLAIDFIPDGFAAEFIDGDALIRYPLELYPGQHHTVHLKMKKLLTPQNIVKAKSNVLYGSALRLVASPKDGSGKILMDKTIYFYRLFDIADDDHADGVISFETTLADGPGGISRNKTLNLEMLQSSNPTFAVSGIAASEFSVLTGFSQALLTFDPQQTGTRAAQLAITSPSGTHVGDLTLSGEGIPPQNILFSKNDLSAAIKQIVDLDDAHVIDGTEAFITKFFRDPLNDPNGRRIFSTDPQYPLRVQVVYNLVQQNAISIFQNSDPVTAQAINFLDSNSGPGIPVNWSLTHPVNQPTIIATNTRAPITGTPIGTTGNPNIRFIVDGQSVTPAGAVTLSLQAGDGPTGPWTNLRNGVVVRRTPKRPDVYKFVDFAHHWFRAVSMQPASATASYNVWVIATSDENACGTNDPPACAAWADFNRAEFKTKILAEENTTSLPQRAFRFARITNQNYNDPGPAGSSFSGVMLILNNLVTGSDITAGIASALDHEIGHDLGAIHLRNKLKDYIGGDIMGSETAGSGGLPTFKTLLPMVQFGLGIPVREASFKKIYKYYRDFLSFEKYAFNPALPHPGDSDADLDLGAPSLTVLGAMPGLNAELPDEVEEFDFGPVVIGTTGGQGSVSLALFNSGDQDLHITGINITGATNAFTVDGLNTLPWTIPPLDLNDLQPEASGRTITVRFVGSQPGLSEGTLEIDSDSLGGQTVSIPLSGTSISKAAQIRVEVTNNNFGGIAVGSPAVPRVGFATIRNVGSQPLLITAVQVDTNYSTGPFLVTGPAANTTDTQPMIVGVGQATNVDLVFAPNVVGLQRGRIAIYSNDPDQKPYWLRVVGTGLAPSGDPLDSLVYGDNYVAMEDLDLPGAPVLRQKSDANGNWSFFLPEGETYHYVVFDRISGLVAHGTGVTAKSGQNTFIGTPVFQASTAPDSNGDGLPDDIKFALGIDPLAVQTNSASIDDFTAVMQGLYPLNGGSAFTGVIGQAPLSGDSRRVVMLDDAAGNQQLAVVGTMFPGGLAVVDVTKPSQPLVLGQIALPGLSWDVAVDPLLRIAAVASTPSTDQAADRIHLVDLSNPQMPQLVQTLPVAANQVQAAFGYVYAGSFGDLRAIDLISGTVVGELALPGNVYLMTLQGDHLYIVELSSSGANLQIVQINGSQMHLQGSVGQLDVGGTGGTGVGQIFVRRGIAYIGAAGHGGYMTVDVSNPDRPVLIAPSAAPTNVSAPNLALAVNESGIGLLIGAQVGTVWLMDASNPTNTFSFLTQYPVPGEPWGICLGSGLAFIADGKAGLVAFKYVPYDTAGVAPSVRIAGVFPGQQLKERNRFEVDPEVTDDGQVVYVELLLNGRVVQRSSSHPYRLAAIAPAIAKVGGQFTIQLRATDSGGLVGLSAPMVLTLAADTPPTVAIKTISGTDPNAGPIQVLEGGTVTVESQAADDTQVSAIELLINGQVVARTVEPPFTIVGTAPYRSSGSNTFVVQLRATDTGGLTTLSAPVTVTLLHDTTPPTLLRTDPADAGSARRELQTVSLFLSKPLSAASLIPANFEVISDAGQVIRPGAFTLQDSNKEVDLQITPLDPGNYKLIIHQANISDRAGNFLGTSDLTIRFTVLTYSIRWNRQINGQWASGSWFNPTNWLPAHVPQSNDWVLIDVPDTNVTVFVESPHLAPTARDSIEPVRIRNLLSSREVDLFYIDLHADKSIQVDAQFDWTASKLTNTRLIAGTNTILTVHESTLVRGNPPYVTAEGYVAALDNVDLEGNFRLGLLGSAGFNLVNHCTLNGSIDGAWKPEFLRGILFFYDDAVLDGSGSIHNCELLLSARKYQFQDPSAAPHNVPITVTLGSNVTVRGELLVSAEGSGATLINQGQMISEQRTDDPTLRYNSSISLISSTFLSDPTSTAVNSFINEGSIEVRNANRLQIQGSLLDTIFVNRGALTVRDGSFLWISATFASGKMVSDQGAISEIQGWLVTQPTEVAELSGRGTWLVSSALFNGGTVRLSDGAVLEGNASFANVTFEGELHNYDFNTGSPRQSQFPQYVLGYSPTISVETNLTLNGRIVFHSTSNWPGNLNFSHGFQNNSPVVLDGNGRVEFQGINDANRIGYLSEIPGQIIFGSGLTIHGQSLAIGNTAQLGLLPPLVENRGTILTQPGDQLRFECGSLTNSGVIHISSNALVHGPAAFVQTATGRLEFDLAGNTPGSTYGQLQVGLSASLDGTLSASLISPFQPSAGNAFQLLTYPTSAGRFASLLTPPLGQGLAWHSEYNNTNFTLRVTPP